MNALHVVASTAGVCLVLRVFYCAWMGEPPAHLAAGGIWLIAMAYGLLGDFGLVTAFGGLNAGWQFARAYLVHTETAQVPLYLDEDGRWKARHPSQWKASE